MDLHLFGSKKDYAEIKDAQDIKAATTQNQGLDLGSAPAFNSNENMADEQTQTNFVNPFAGNSQTTEQSMPNLNSNNNQSPFELRENDLATPKQSTVQQSITTSEPSIEESMKEDTYTKDQIQEIIAETVEKVIEERWEQLLDKVNKVAAWKEKQDAHINMIAEDIVTMKDGVEKLEKRLINKVESYDKNILDVNSEIKALEKVFQKITPTLVNNVNELTKITQGFRDDKKSKEELIE